MNKVILLGRLGKDPVLKYTNVNNTAVCDFTLAVNRRFNKQGAEKQTDFFNIIFWDKTAEICSKYLTKGRQIVVVGRIENRHYDDTEGRRHYITEIIGEEMHFADSKKGDEPQGGGNPTQFGVSEDSNPTGFRAIEEGDDLPF